MRLPWKLMFLAKNYLFSPCYKSTRNDGIFCPLWRVCIFVHTRCLCICPNCYEEIETSGRQRINVRLWSCIPTRIGCISGMVSHTFVFLLAGSWFLIKCFDLFRSYTHLRNLHMIPTGDKRNVIWNRNVVSVIFFFCGVYSLYLLIIWD